MIGHVLLCSHRPVTRGEDVEVGLLDPPQSLLPFTSASGFVRDWLGVFHVVSVGAETIVEAMDAIEAHRLSFRDATLWATARQSGCSAILTEDMQDGRRLGGVEFINSVTTEAAARLEPPLQS